MSKRSATTARPGAEKACATGTSQRRARLVAGIVTLVGLLLVGMLVKRLGLPPVAVPPDPDLSQTPAEVAAAVRQARETVLQEPHSGKAWGKLGMVLFAHHFEHEMVSCFEHAAQLDEADFRWPYLLGLGLAVSDPTRAEQEFREALARHGEIGVIHTRLAELLLAQQKYDEAGQHLRTAIERKPNDVRAYLGMARLAMLCGDVPSALPWAEHAAQLAPEIRDVHELLALLYQRSGQRAAALRELSAAATYRQGDLMWDDPVAAEVLELRRDTRRSLEQAEALAAQEQYAEAARVLRAAVEADDREPELYAVYGRVLAQGGRLPEAADVLDRGLKRHPEAVEIHFQRGVVAFLAKDNDRAAQGFRAALARKPDYALAYYNLGHTALRQRDWQGAAEAFREAIRCRPDYADAHVNLGRALLEQGQEEEAVDSLQAALKLAPSHRDARQLLDRAQKKPPP